MTPLCRATASSPRDDSLVIRAPTIQDNHFKTLIDSGATKNICSDSYVREKSLSNHPLLNPFRIRLADGTSRMARDGVIIEFITGSLKSSQSFIVTRLFGTNQIILGIEFLK